MGAKITNACVLQSLNDWRIFACHHDIHIHTLFGNEVTDWRRPLHTHTGTCVFFNTFARNFLSISYRFYLMIWMSDCCMWFSLPNFCPYFTENNNHHIWLKSNKFMHKINELHSNEYLMERTPTRGTLYAINAYLMGHFVYIWCEDNCHFGHRLTRIQIYWNGHIKHEINQIETSVCQ